MQQCDKYEEALWEAAASGDVPEALLAHCTNCRRCREALNDLPRMIAGLSRLQRLETPAPRPVLASPRVVTTSRLRYVPGIAAVLCLMLLFVTIGYRFLPRHETIPISPAFPRDTFKPHEYVRLPAAPDLHPREHVVPVHHHHHHGQTSVRGRSTHHEMLPIPTRSMGTSREPTPDIIPIIGSAPPDPGKAISLDVDRIVSFDEAPAVNNQIYQAMETLNGKDTDEYISIYRKSPDG